MKKLFFLVVAALLVGVVCFAILNWAFKLNYDVSLNLTLVAGATGLLLEYLKPLLKKKRQQKNYI